MPKKLDITPEERIARKKEADRKNYLKNRDRELARAKAKYQDPDFKKAHGEYHKKWFEENREECYAYQRERWNSEEQVKKRALTAKPKRKKLTPEELAANKKAQDAKHYREHKEECRERQRKWTEENREKVREQKRQYAKDHPEQRENYEKNNSEKVKSTQKLWRKNNKDKMEITHKRWREENKEYVKQTKKEQYQQNREEILANAKVHYRKPGIKEAKALYGKEYRLKNLDTLDAKNNERYHTDIQFRLKQNSNTMIRQSMRKQGLCKNKRTTELIGCSIAELKNHLEKQFTIGMSWENWTMRGWHIDHIIPCASFDLSDPIQQKKCYHYTNLRPLWWIYNFLKSDMLPDEWAEYQIRQTDYLNQMYQKHIVPLLPPYDL